MLILSIFITSIAIEVRMELNPIEMKKKLCYSYPLVAVLVQQI